MLQGFSAPETAVPVLWLCSPVHGRNCQPRKHPTLSPGIEALLLGVGDCRTGEACQKPILQTPGDLHHRWLGLGEIWRRLLIR
jgi:hypothetical protein